MNRSDAKSLLRRLSVLGVLLICLFLVSSGKWTINADVPYCPRDAYCEPDCPPGVLCSRCPANVVCVPPNTFCDTCGVQARLIEGSCLNVGDLSTCAWTCNQVKCPLKNSGNCENAEMPLCEGSQIAVCNGGTWVCDDSGAIGYGCSGNPPYCQYGSFCYGGSYYCADNPNTSCSGSAPTCSDPSTHAVCSAGLWYCVP